MFFIDWLHTYQPPELLFSLGPVSIHWYGFLMTLAVVIGFIIARFLFKQYNIGSNHLIDLGFYLVIFSLLGARLAHVVVELPYYIENPDQIFAIWQGGLAIHGAILAGMIVILFYVRKHKDFCELNLRYVTKQEGYKIQDTKVQTKNNNQNPKSKKNLFLVSCFLFLADILVLPLILGQVIGRWGNYFNQELYGQPTDLPWGIPISVANRVPGFENFTHFHPTFLYESLANLILFVLLFYIIKNRDNLKFSLLKQPGIIFTFYLLGYSVIRLLTEFLRIDRMPLIGDIRLAIIISGLLMIVALWLMWYIYKQKENRV